MHALIIDNISFGYTSGTVTLKDMAFSVARGEFLSFVGPNGSGKTTLLRLLDRIYVPHKGNIFLFDRNISTYSRTEIAKRIAFVPQEMVNAFPFTVFETVLMGRSPHCHGRMFENQHDRKIAFAMLERTDIAHLADRPVTTLSGGERQRTYLARALAQEPEIILLDEPNAHLDITHQVEAFRLMRTLNKESGVTVVSVSHDLNLAAAFSDRIGMIADGTLSSIGSPKDVLTPQSIKHVFKADVLVDQHPTTLSPRITLLTS